MANEPSIVQAIYSFKGSNNDELCFKKGDLITVTQKDEGWWEGTLNGKTGWFPSNYVKECKDAPKPVVNPQNQYKSVVLNDLIDSEKAHVTELEGLVSNFLQPLEKSSILSQDEYKQLTGNITDVLETHQQLLSLIEAESNKPGNEQRVGKLFLTWAPKIKNVHQMYCSLHPRAVCILDKYREELTKYMESKGAASPGALVLTTMLSKPFRRLDKYSGMLQELERHVEECHPDRGDTQRSVSVYKDIATTCSAIRRQKELELQVLTGPVRGWEGPSLTSLGEIIYMGSVAVGPQHHDRYFVLFPTTLVILSVSHRLSAFIYEGKLFLSGLTVTRLEDSDQYKNAFEISAPMIDKRVAVCQSREEADHWVELLRKQMPRSSTASTISQKVAPSQAQFVPQPPPHLQRLNQRGYSNRTSVLSYNIDLRYKPTYPPENYPSAAPYAALTKLFHKLIKTKLLNRQLLKQLLYSEHLNKSNLHLVKIRHHVTEISIMTRDIHCRDSVIECDSDTEDETSDAESRGSNIKRQNAVDTSSSDDDSSSSSNPFGYIRYYNPQTGSGHEVTKYESFIDHGEQCPTVTGPKVVVDVPKKRSVLLVSTANLLLQKQYSEESEASSCFPEPKPYMACEDLSHLDGNVELGTLHVPERYVPTTRQSCPTKLVGNKFNQSSLTTIYIPSWSNSDSANGKSKSNEDIAKRKTASSKNDSSCSSTTHSSSLELPVNTLPLPDRMVAELLYNFDGEFTKSESIESDFTEHSSKTVIKPPTMFEGRVEEDVKVVPQTVSLNLDNVGFRKHSINSDKPKRRSSIQINPQDLKKNSDMRRCVTSRFLQMSNPTTSRQSFCRCCRDSCHSPRSSDSGMAGSCTLISPDIVNDLASCSAQERCSTDMANLFQKYNNFGQFDGDTNVISLSDIEARDFESQCPCTSPFGSTPRTSGQDCVNENVLTGSRDSLRTSVTSSIDINPKTWGSQPKLHSRIFIEPKTVPDPNVEEWKSGPQKSHSTSCLLEEGQDEGEVAENEEGPLMYKSGLYAHWWLKAKIPASVIKGIYMDSRSPTTDVSTSSRRANKPNK
ncbi:uncharacterized protein LOC108916034 [Anoplophora glabripennis]|uniref:uncharacterized protein LOC108916034 n=1 Tax=Anoplophora glabripennis TaxID=217634 RepID=UPI0008746BA2|nr:uncharacterized protein LOC108916034 [Anoplophora glabripennis]